ncbi:MAG: hypothetical protein GEU86_12915 [Actinophytocola sp.]|nr:hypothetical protein [Actinophytocola sp.]
MAEHVYSAQAFTALVAAFDHEYDFADWLTGVVAALTVRVGGLDALLAGRPGSWESAAIAGWMRSAGCEVPEVADELQARASCLQIAAQACRTRPDDAEGGEA